LLHALKYIGLGIKRGLTQSITIYWIVWRNNAYHCRIR